MSDIRVIAPGRRDRLGEGPLWSPRHDALFWVDILGWRIHRMTLADERIESFEQQGYAAWIIEREAGGFVAGIGRNIVRFEPGRSEHEVLASIDDPGQRGNRLNDAKADRAGRIWAGTMPVTCDRPSGAFFRFDPDGMLARVDGPYTIPNGPAIGNDGDYLLHTDTARRTIFRFDIRDDGSLGEASPFIRFDEEWGNPDGMTFDAEGGLWVACWGAGRVMRFAPDGTPDRHIDLPASQITSCTFAGDALDRMFVTSAGDGVNEPHGGALFEVDPGCKGLPPHRYLG